MRSGDDEAAASFVREWAALDTRFLGNTAHPGHTHLAEDEDRPARAQLWIRVDGDLGDDPDLQVAAFTYASDLTLLGASLVPHDVEIGSPDLMPASLDHTIWFHRPVPRRPVVALRPVVTVGVRRPGLSLARVFTEDGRLVATVAQEGLIRQRTR